MPLNLECAFFIHRIDRDTLLRKFTNKFVNLNSRFDVWHSFVRLIAEHQILHDLSIAKEVKIIGVREYY